MLWLVFRPSLVPALSVTRAGGLVVKNGTNPRAAVCRGMPGRRLRSAQGRAVTHRGTFRDGAAPADGVNGVGPHLVQLAAVRHTRRRAAARYGPGATATGENCPVTRVVGGAAGQRGLVDRPDGVVVIIEPPVRPIIEPPYD
jgi:hypothetical protein